MARTTATAAVGQIKPTINKPKSDPGEDEDARKEKKNLPTASNLGLGARKAKKKNAHQSYDWLPG